MKAMNDDKHKMLDEGICPHCGGDSCWYFDDGGGLRCAVTEKIVATKDELALRKGPAITLQEAFDRFLRDYSTEGCPNPECTVCRRSKQALEAFRVTLKKADK